MEYIDRLECDAQRQFSEYEKTKFAAEWFNTTEKKIRKYLVDIVNIKNSGTFDEEILHDYDSIYENTSEELLIKSEVNEEYNKKIHEAISSIFSKGYKNTKPLRRALFTAQCLSKDTDIDWLGKNFSWIHEYLDEETLEIYKNQGKAPTNRDIFLMKNKSHAKNPDQSVSPHFTNLMKDLEAALRERNIKFFF